MIENFKESSTICQSRPKSRMPVLILVSNGDVRRSFRICSQLSMKRFNIGSGMLRLSSCMLRLGLTSSVQGGQEEGSQTLRRGGSVLGPMRYCHDGRSLTGKPLISFVRESHNKNKFPCSLCIKWRMGCSLCPLIKILLALITCLIALICEFVFKYGNGIIHCAAAPHVECLIFCLFWASCVLARGSRS